MCCKLYTNLALGSERDGVREVDGKRMRRTRREGEKKCYILGKVGESANFIPVFDGVTFQI